MRTNYTRRQLIKSLSMESGGGAEVTLQTTIANEVIPLIRDINYMRGIAEKAGTLINMNKPKIRVPKFNRARGTYHVKPGQPAPEFQMNLDGIDIQPEKLMSWLYIEQEVFEDSTIRDIEGMIKQEMANDFAETEEIGFLFGDRDAVWDNGDPRGAFDGLFKSSGNIYTWNGSLDQSGADPNNVVFSNLVMAAQKLGKYGRNKRKLVYLVPTMAEAALIRSDKFQRTSAYAYGSGAGMFTGEIGRINGGTVIASTWLDAPEGGSYGNAIVFEESAFSIADWQKFDIKLYNEIGARTDEVAIRARERVAYATRYPQAIVSINNFPAVV